MARFIFFLLLASLLLLLLSLSVATRPIPGLDLVRLPSSSPMHVGAPESYRQSEKHDKSIAGGEVIIGGLATATFAAVFAYIRLPTNSPSSTLPFESRTPPSTFPSSTIFSMSFLLPIRIKNSSLDLSIFNNLLHVLLAVSMAVMAMALMMV
ncbi:uncharacterized protein A4U43_C06F2580 [Asparagus officinalis]|uniref:Uncharacterized protein n=1 Tax=Asparagus officinalis TaxID=4686 RepID=A0A5P1EJL8_ASPOF|nr:uncharacterized protein A4U43_C06F2580 [Asparagus officinalis]